ncbi:MAG TPA: hypothetical protein VNR87_08020 [Flavisolibacter sp.]|nr:hypothetical protein [Flavisolibacter sp.]
MKPFTSVLTLCALAILINTSCTKTASSKVFADDPFDSNGTALSQQGSSKNTGNLVEGVIGDLGADLTNLTFCNAKTVPICAGQTMNVGEVSVQTAIDGKTYVTYTVRGLWYIKELHLYAGDQEDIPLNNSGSPAPGQFPYTKTFTVPYVNQKYTFVIDNLPSAYVVAAHASLVKITSNGTQIDAQTGWGDGCTGKKIVEQGSWGTFVNYVGSACTIAQAATENIELCSFPINNFFWIDQANPDAKYWRVPSVTVGGYSYTESEAKAISATGDNNSGPGSGNPQDSKFAFVRAATLKLSSTEYQKSPILAPAMDAIEGWLKTQGKLSPTNLPTGNATVKNAASLIDTWIQTHSCAIEE